MSELAQPVAAARETHRFVFSGTAREYFGIWIVNVLLTIVTIGIYSAWAKVRRQRYFYGNTTLAGHAFEYHARGSQILLGRIIVVAGFAIYNILITAVPLVGLLVLLAFGLLFPWLLMRGIRFNARVSSYRNVRFDFVGGYWGAARAFGLAPLVGFVSLGFLLPVASRWTIAYVHGNLRYGGRPFSVAPSLGALYRVWLLPAIMVFAGFAIAAAIGLALFVVHAAAGGLKLEDAETLAFVVVLYGAILAYLVVFGLASLVYGAGVRNVGYSATLFDGRHPLASDLPRWRYAWVAVSNLVVTVLTLGLMRPWAAIRMARLHAAHTAMTFDGPIGEIVSVIEADGSAVGAEYASIEGFDFGF